MALTQLDTTAPLPVGPPSNDGSAPAGQVILDFPTGLPGFPGHQSFVLEDLGPSLAPFLRMRSTTTADLAFTVVAPGHLFPDYAISVDEEHVARLGLTEAADAAILCIVTIPPPPQQPTINLLGPVVVNRTTGTAAQVVQHRSSYGVAVPCLPASPDSDAPEDGDAGSPASASPAGR